MMRVLHVIGPLRTGGAQTQLLGLVRAAHGSLWDATVIATSGGALADDFAALGCPFTELRRLASPGLLRMRSVRQIARGGGFDVIHGNLWQSNLYCRTAVLGRSERPAVVISERNVEAGRGHVRRWLDARLASVTDAYTGNTTAVCDFIRDVHPVTDQEVSVIPNAVDDAVFHPRTTVSRAGPLRIGSIGRLDLEKGFDVLIDAFRSLSDDVDAELHIVGEGPERDGLGMRAGALPVIFHGLLEPGRPVADFLRELDVFVLPSTYREGRPNALLEALATGLPVVATDIQGINEIIRGPTLVRPGDPRALADAIRHATRVPNRWIERSDALSSSNFDELAARYAAVFTRAMDRASASS